MKQKKKPAVKTGCAGHHTVFSVHPDVYLALRHPSMAAMEQMGAIWAERTPPERRPTVYVDACFPEFCPEALAILVPDLPPAGRPLVTDALATMKAEVVSVRPRLP